MDGHSEQDQHHHVHAKARPSDSADDLGKTDGSHRNYRHIEAVDKRRFGTEKLVADPAHRINAQQQNQANPESAAHFSNGCALSGLHSLRSWRGDSRTNFEISKL